MKKLLLLSIILLGSLMNCLSPIPQYPLNLDSEIHLSGHNNSFGIGSAKVLKKGESCYASILYQGLLDYGITQKISVDEAVFNGDITKIATIDYSSTSTLIYYKNCIIVWGE
ncbi:MAG: hypothetical protein KDK36_18100 [Leptospiraceae bacterium]|nr:hypothetical protein [Leptospiraceae bacterium]